MGSTREARNAGRNPAKSPNRVRKAVAASIVIGSVGVKPNSIEDTSGKSAHAMVDPRKRLMVEDIRCQSVVSWASCFLPAAVME
jgi:hypothetical protein